MHIIYVYKSFSTMLDKGLRKNIKQKSDGEIGKQTKWNGSTAYDSHKETVQLKISNYTNYF